MRIVHPGNNFVYREPSKSRDIVPAATEEKLEAIAAYCQHLKMFNPEKGRDYSPPEGTIFHDLYKKGKLNRRQCMAAQQIYDDSLGAYGNSGAQKAPYNPRIDSESTRSGAVMSYTNPAQERLTALVRSLRKHERSMMVTVVLEFDRRGKKIPMDALGAILGGCYHPREAIGNVAGHVQSFLNSVAEFYESQPRETERRLTRPSRIGSLTRQLRIINNHEPIETMASKLKISVSYLRNIEIGVNHPPAGFADRIINVYSLNTSQQDAVREIIHLHKMSGR